MPAVALVGPRQVGKTTLALEIAKSRPAVYLDLESAEDVARIENPRIYFEDHADELVVLDEIHRLPGVFGELRGVIDAGRREDKGEGRFLILGSAGLDLLAQSGETLAGRIAFVELTPFELIEVGAERIDDLWVRGGFPDSFLAEDDKLSLEWRDHFIRTYLERDIPQFGLRIPAATLRRMWTMLAHNQGGQLNVSQLARNLELSSPTVSHYIDLLVDLLLVRRLSPRHANVGKRLVRSPKVYVRDSGLVHALLGIGSKEALLGHPVVGMSWEGMAIENLLTVVGDEALAELLSHPKRRRDRSDSRLAERRNVGDRDQADLGSQGRTEPALRPRRPQAPAQLRRLRRRRAIPPVRGRRSDRPGRAVRGAHCIAQLRL